MKLISASIYFGIAYKELGICKNNVNTEYDCKILAEICLKLREHTVHFWSVIFMMGKIKGKESSVTI